MRMIYTTAKIHSDEKQIFPNLQGCFFLSHHIIGDTEKLPIAISAAVSPPSSVNTSSPHGATLQLLLVLLQQTICRRLICCPDHHTTARCQRHVSESSCDFSQCGLQVRVVVFTPPPTSSASPPPSPPSEGSSGDLAAVRGRVRAE